MTSITNLSNNTYNVLDFLIKPLTFTSERQYPPKKWDTIDSSITTISYNKKEAYNINFSITTGNYGIGTYSVSYSNKFIIGNKYYDLPANNLFDYLNDINNSADFLNTNLVGYNSSGNYIGDKYLNETTGIIYKGDWFFIKLPYQIILTKIEIIGVANYIIRSPALWKIYGSNNGITWEEIIDASNTIRLTQANYINNSFSKVLNNSLKLYNYIGMCINAIISGTELHFAEFKIFGKEIIKPILSQIISTQSVIYTPERQYPPKSFNTSTQPIKISGDIINILPISYYKETIALNTHNINYGSGTYEIYSSSTLNDNIAWRKQELFNFNIYGEEHNGGGHWDQLYKQIDGYYTGNKYINNNYLGEWIIINLPLPIILTKFTFNQRTINSGYRRTAPARWKCYGSNNGSIFTEITEASQEIELTLNDYINGTYTKQFNNNTFYKYIGFTFNKIIGGNSSTGLIFMNFAELQLFGKEIIPAPTIQLTDTDILIYNIIISFSNSINNIINKLNNNNNINSVTNKLLLLFNYLNYNLKNVNNNILYLNDNDNNNKEINTEKKYNIEDTNNINLFQILSNNLKVLNNNLKLNINNYNDNTNINLKLYRLLNILNNIIVDTINNYSFIVNLDVPNILQNIVPSTINYSTTFFTYSNSIETIKIPSNINFINIYCWGAGGASGYSYINNGSGGYGGNGGFVSATLNVSSISSLKIVVGQGGRKGIRGGNSGKAFGGGGNGNGIEGNWACGGGGGLSGIFVNNDNMTITDTIINSNAIPILIAGGGGSAGSTNNSLHGGNAGGLIGNNGSGIQAYGSGGTQITGGMSGTSNILYPPNDNAGNKYKGGNTSEYGGGGGGGYYGGGGGKYIDGNIVVGGGGGSSYINSNNFILSNLNISEVFKNGTRTVSGNTNKYYKPNIGLGANFGLNNGNNGLIVIEYINPSTIPFKIPKLTVYPPFIIPSSNSGNTNNQIVNFTTEIIDNNNDLKTIETSYNIVVGSSYLAWGGQGAYALIDNNQNSFWKSTFNIYFPHYTGSNSLSTSIPYKGEWFYLKLPKKINLVQYSLGLAGQGPAEWKIYGSNDGINWTEIPQASQNASINSTNFINNNYTVVLNKPSELYQYFGCVIGKVFSAFGDYTVCVSDCKFYSLE